VDSGLRVDWGLSCTKLAPKPESTPILAHLIAQEPLMYHGAHWRCEPAWAERINVEDPVSTEDLVPQGVPKTPHNPDPPR